MAKKKTTKKTSKVPRRRNMKVTLSDGTEVECDGDNRRLVRKNVYAPLDVDPESLPPPKDEYSKLEYPPPRNNSQFREYWGRFIDSVTTRENFNDGHLDLLRVLCDLYVELEELNSFIRINGRSFKVITTTGDMWRMFPEVSQKDKVIAQIQTYSKNLDLFPKKDKSTGSGSGTGGRDEESWG